MLWRLVVLLLVVVVVVVVDLFLVKNDEGD